MKKRRHNRTGRNTEQQEHFTTMLRNTMQTDAWRALSSTAQALYPWLKLEWHGPQYNNNGKIRLSTRQAASFLGCTADTANRAFQDLQAKGFLVVVKPAYLGSHGAGQSPCYEITECAMPGAEKGEPRKLFLQWSKGNDFKVIKHCPNNPKGLNGKK